MYRTSPSRRQTQQSTRQISSKITFLNYLSQQPETKPTSKIERSIFWDKEHLYEQNLMLRSKIKELSQNNSKTKAQLIKTERNIHELAMQTKNQKINQSVFKSLSKSQSLFKKRSLVSYKEQKDIQGTFVNALKNNISQLKVKVDTLKNQNENLKRSLKYTRMSELQTENKQLQEENIRLYNLNIETKRIWEQANFQIMKQFDDHNTRLRKETQAKNEIFKQLNKTTKELKQMTINYQQLQSEMQQKINRLTAQLQRIRGKNAKSKSPIPEDYSSHNKLNYSHTASAFHKIQPKIPLSSDKLFNSQEFLLTDNKLPQISVEHESEEPTSQQQIQSIDPIEKDKTVQEKLSSTKQVEEGSKPIKQEETKLIKEQFITPMKGEEKNTIREQKAIPIKGGEATSLNKEKVKQQTNNEMAISNEIKQEEYAEEFEEGEEKVLHKGSSNSPEDIKELYLEEEYEEQDFQRL